MSDQSNQAVPNRVRNAVALLWVSLALGLLVSVIAPAPATSAASPVLVYSIILITTLLLAFLVYKIGQGRNWARIIFVVMTVIGLVPYMSALSEIFNRSALGGAISTAQTIMQVVAIYFLLSKPGALWFRKAASKTTV